MSSTRSLAAGLAVVAAGAVTAAVLATTGATAETAPHGRPGTPGAFTVTVHHGSEANLDLGTSGFGPGDQDLFTGAITRGGRKVGHLVGSCTTVRANHTSADQLCEFVLRLGTAQINASGTVTSGRQGPGTFRLPIVGGTDRYRDAGGQIAVTATNGKTFPIQISLS